MRAGVTEALPNGKFGVNELRSSRSGRHKQRLVGLHVAGNLVLQYGIADRVHASRGEVPQPGPEFGTESPYEIAELEFGVRGNEAGRTAARSAAAYAGLQDANTLLACRQQSGTHEAHHPAADYDDVDAYGFPERRKRFYFVIEPENGVAHRNRACDATAYRPAARQRSETLVPPKANELDMAVVSVATGRAYSAT